jgi:uncharacterized MAPEG superfamily protein
MSLAFICVFAAGLLPVLTAFIAKADKRLDLHNPRDVHAVQTGVRKRAYGAHMNGNEAFPLFAAGVILAYLRGTPPHLLDAAALTWLLLRLAYTGAYLADLARARALLWLLSVLAAAGLYLLPA